MKGSCTHFPKYNYYENKYVLGYYPDSQAYDFNFILDKNPE